MTEHHHGKKHRNYILVKDLGDKVESFNKYGIKAPCADDSIFTEFEEGLKARIEDIAGCAVVDIRMKDMSENILSAAFARHKSLKNAIVVSSCAEIARSDSGWIEEGHIVNLNRLTDGAGNHLGIGSRPGFEPIIDQIQKIRASAIGSSFNHPLILVEDGLFSGETLRFLVRELRAAGLRINAIVLGFAFPSGLNALRVDYDGDIIVIHEFEGLVDWVPDHDFVPFTPNSGKVLGVSINGSLYPHYSEEGASYAFPYMTTFAPIHMWASIPTEASAKLSLYCAQWALRLFQQIEDMNEKPLMIGNLFPIKPRISIPISVGQKRFPLPTARVTEFLSDVCQELA